MNKTPPNYTEEFNRDAVRLVETSGKPRTQIARELGVSDSALYRWLRDRLKSPLPAVVIIWNWANRARCWPIHTSRSSG